MRVLRGSLACAVGLVIAGSAPPCRADGASRAAAEALFEKGRAALSRQDYAAACPALEESNRLDPAPGTLANLASCEEQRGHLAAAWQGYTDVAAELKENDPRRAIALQRAGALKARLANLSVRLAPGNGADVRVLRDSVELRGASLGTALPVDPGAHHVVVSEPGRLDAVFDVVLHEAETKELVVSAGAPAGSERGVAKPALAPASAPAPLPSKPKATGASSGARTAGFVVGGVGVVGLGTALVLGGIVLGKKHTVNEHCDSASRACDQTGLDAASSGRTLSAVSTTAFVVGAVATGVGAYLVLARHDRRPAATLEIGGAAGGGLIDVKGAF